jgi:tryptophan-rich sensory protein
MDSTPGRWSAPLAAATFGGAVAAAAALGGAATRRTVRRPWYAALRKPPWQPPRAAFGPVWTALYALSAGSAYRVARAPGAARRPALGLWAIQHAANAAWSPLFFGLRRPRAALADAAALGVAAAAYARAAARVDRAAAWMMAPYLAWVGFAVALNGAIVARNRRSLARR